MISSASSSSRRVDRVDGRRRVRAPPISHPSCPFTVVFGRLDGLFVLFRMIHVSELFQRVCGMSHLRTFSHRRTRRIPISFSRVYTRVHTDGPCPRRRHNSPTTTTTSTSSRRIDDDDDIDTDIDVDVHRASSSSRVLGLVPRRPKDSSRANPRARGGGTTARRRRRWRRALDVSRDVVLANGESARAVCVESSAWTMARADARGRGFIVV